MNDYNIEFSHIYADEEFGEEQEKSIILLKGLIKKIKSNKITTSVIIDDYNPKIKILREEELLDKMANMGVTPDFVIFESNLKEVADELIEKIDKNFVRKERFSGKDVILVKKGDKNIGLRDSKGKYSCAVLIAAWNLCRLGLLPIDEKKFYKTSNNDFEAKKIISIIPKKYQDNELRAKKIIEVSPYKEHLSKIDYIFF